MIAENCPNLSQLWLRCNHFTNPDLSNAPEFSPNIEHSHLKKLAVLYLRVGENNYNTCKLQPYVFHYLLRNAGDTLRDTVAPGSKIPRSLRSDFRHHSFSHRLKILCYHLPRCHSLIHYEIEGALQNLDLETLNMA